MLSLVAIGTAAAISRGAHGTKPPCRISGAATRADAWSNSRDRGVQ